MSVVATLTQSLFLHNHSVVNVETKIIKSLFVIHDFGVVNLVLKCKYICHDHLWSERSKNRFKDGTKICIFEITV